MTQGSYNINWDLICIANCVILQHYLDLQKTGFKVFLNWLSETIWQHPYAFSAFLGICLEYFIRSKHIHLHIYLYWHREWKQGAMWGYWGNDGTLPQIHKKLWTRCCCCSDKPWEKQTGRKRTSLLGLCKTMVERISPD